MLLAKLGKNLTRLEYTRSSRQLFANPTLLRALNSNDTSRRFQNGSQPATAASTTATATTSAPSEPKKSRPMHAQFLEIRARLISYEDEERLRRISEQYQDLLRLRPAEKKEATEEAKEKEVKGQASDDYATEAEAEQAATATPEEKTKEAPSPNERANEPPIALLPRPKTREEYSTLLQLFARLNQKQPGVALMRRLREKGVRLRFVDYHHLLQLYARAHARPTAEETQHATEMAAELNRYGAMRRRTHFFLLQVYARAGLHEQAMATFRAIEEMQAEQNEKKQAREAAAHEVDSRDETGGQEAVAFTPGVLSYCNLIEMYAEVNAHVQVDALWREMRAKYLLYPRITAYIAMVSMYSRLENVPAQVEVMDEMRQRVKEPTQNVCNLYLSVCAKAGLWRLGLDILADLRHRQAEMEKRGVPIYHPAMNEEWRAKICDRTEALVIELFKQLEPEERLQAVGHLQALIEAKGLARDVLFDCIFAKYLPEAAAIDLNLREGRA